MDLGSCSIEIPSQWHVHDKKARDWLGRLNNDPKKDRLLASQDKSNVDEMSMIARVNNFPSSKEDYEEVKTLTNSDLTILTEQVREN